jgi:tight adherence protein C
MSIELIGLVALIVAAMTGAAWAYVASKPRESVLSRISGFQPEEIHSAPLLRQEDKTWTSRVGNWLTPLLPSWVVTEVQSQSLMYAGYRSDAATGWFGLARVASIVLIPLTAASIVQGMKTMMQVSIMGTAFAIGFLAPIVWLNNRRDARQKRIRRGVPDSLDLTLVCVEAGVSLDAAILRVGKELAIAHPDLSYELIMLNRRMNAGLTREEALRGLFEGTGVQELRLLATNINQSTRWGTSMSRVLRVTSEILRRQHKEAAEKRAALASTKMVFPLALMILPALLVIIYGSALINLKAVFSRITP